MVDFKLDGPAEWRGGIGQGPDNFVLSTSLPAECGVNRALIRTLTQSGKITLKATSAGLKEDVLVFESTPFEVQNGLSKLLPSEGLKSTFRRGETPSSPSYKVTRKTVKIISANAGVNIDKVANSYDDNELTEWGNDGKVGTGVITYQLEKKSKITEVSLKLSGWRNRTYPLQILVDKKKVWEGETKQSLGYVTLPVKPTKGRTVTIKLTGEGSVNDAFQNMVELNGTKELDGFKDPKGFNNKGNL
jgi:hypothetical protein